MFSGRAPFILILLLMATAGLHADASSRGEEGQAEQSSNLPSPRWDRRNLTEDRAKVAEFVDSLLGTDRVPAKFPESDPLETENGAAK